MEVANQENGATCFNTLRITFICDFFFFLDLFPASPHASLGFALLELQMNAFFICVSHMYCHSIEQHLQPRIGPYLVLDNICYFFYHLILWSKVF